ncbi:MAG: single-stranded-DNA-specific exonuclease RecJ [Candidatus Cloacimonadota bacterium]|nr:MAG: single-stranded-DNA-specific exonuclease RecJ [Candidatus Cloacimonadota bacterium]
MAYDKNIHCILPQKFDNNRVCQLQQALSLSRPVVEILLNRGYHSCDEMRGVLFPSLDDLHDPFLFNDMEKATERIVKAIKEKERILIYGDYDVDGVTAVTLLVKNFHAFCADVFYYIPDRQKEGYGLSVESIDSFQKKGIKLIITVDCGINAVDAINHANAAGLDVIVTDHHSQQRSLDNAYAIINPKAEGENYPFRELAGVGVAFKLLDGLVKKMKGGKEHFEDLDLVVLGTIADIVSLKGENRALTHQGLEALNSTRKTGLCALLEKAKCRKGDISSHDIAFILGPRLNASGRIGTAQRSVELLLTDDRGNAWEHASYLDKANRTRRELQERVLNESIEMIEREGYGMGINGIVLEKHDWHEGVIGIAASKISERYARPTILISTAGAFGKGSGRSIKGFSLFDALRQCTEYLVRFGGHQHAAGITIEKKNISAFRNAFNRIVGEMLTEEDFVSELQVDCIASFNEINGKLLDELKLFEPFGVDNEKPVFRTSSVDFVGYPRIVGKKHLKTRVRKGKMIFEAIGFGQGALVKEIEIGRNIYTIDYKIEKNVYKGKKSIQLHLVHIEKH